MHAALACATSRVRCGSLVYSIGYRHPAVLAKAITTIDQLSGGRADMGLGAGWAQVEYAAFGIPFPAAGRSARPDGRGRPGPARPAARRGHDVRGHVLPRHRGAQRAASGAGQAADLDRRAGREAHAAHRGAVRRRVERAVPGARAVRRASATCCIATAPTSGAIRVDIRCAINVGLAWTEESLRGQFGGMADFVRPGVLSGSVDEVVERVGRYVEAGADQVNLALRAPFDVDALEQFAAALLST